MNKISLSLNKFLKFARRIYYSPLFRPKSNWTIRHWCNKPERRVLAEWFWWNAWHNGISFSIKMTLDVLINRKKYYTWWEKETGLLLKR